MCPYATVLSAVVSSRNSFGFSMRLKCVCHQNLEETCRLSWLHSTTSLILVMRRRSGHRSGDSIGNSQACDALSPLSIDLSVLLSNYGHRSRSGDPSEGGSPRLNANMLPAQQVNGVERKLYDRRTAPRLLFFRVAVLRTLRMGTGIPSDGSVSSFLIQDFFISSFAHKK